MSKSRKSTKPQSHGDEKFPLPVYSADEDIYKKEKEVEYDEDGKTKKVLKEEDDSPAGGLDVPGSELDDADEAIGEEDEENNYYSLGGEDHADLEEDNQ
jgi:hypothetical protein